MDIALLIISALIGFAIAVFGIWAFLRGFQSGLDAKNGAAPKGLFEKVETQVNNTCVPISKQISEMFRTDDSKEER